MKIDFDDNIPEIDIEIPYNYGKKRNLSIKEIREYYPSIAHYKSALLLTEYDSIYNEQILNEFTTRSIRKELLKSQLIKRFSGKFEKCFIHYNGEDGFWIRFKYNQYEYIKEVNKFIDSFGWYPSSIVNNDDIPYIDDIEKLKEINKYLIINYLPKFDTEINIKQYDYLYHVTSNLYIQKIMDIGLTPKNKSKISNNPERIYFLLPTTDANMIKTIQKLHHTSTNKSSINNWYILQIDIKELPDYLKFYDDPMFQIGNGAVWTYQNIPPKFIKIYKKINVI